MSSTWLQRGFVRSVALVASGALAAQAVTVLASPVLTRLYEPSAFGVLAVFTSITTIVSVVASFRYELAIPIPDQDKDAAGLVVLSVCLLAAVSGAAFLSVTAGRAWIPAGLTDIGWIVPIAVFGTGLFQIFQYWTIRRKDFKRISRARVGQASLQVAIQIAAGAAGGGVLGLVIGSVVGRVAGVGSLMRPWLKSGAVSPGAVGMRRVANRYRHYPLYSLPASLLNSVSTNIPVVVLAWLFTDAVAGWFALSIRTLQMPVILLGQAVSQVFLSRAGSAHRDGSLSTLTRQAVRSLAELGFVPFVAAATVAPELFGLVFGAEWRVSGEYVRILAPWLFLVFVASPVSTTVLVVEKQRGEMVFQGATLVLRLCTLLAGSHLGGAKVAILGYGIVSALCWMAYLLWVARIAGSGAVSVLRDLAEVAATGALWVTPLFVLALLGSSYNVLFMAAATAAVASTALIMKRRGWLV